MTSLRKIRMRIGFLDLPQKVFSDFEEKADEKGGFEKVFFWAKNGEKRASFSKFPGSLLNEEKSHPPPKAHEDTSNWRLRGRKPDYLTEMVFVLKSVMITLPKLFLNYFGNN